MAKQPPRPLHEHSSVRDKTIKHLRQLLSTAAVTGASLAAVACEETVVCDPLPPPLECTSFTSEVQQWVWWQAEWRDDAGNLVIDFEARIETTSRLAFRVIPQVVGATILDEQFAADELWVTLEPSTDTVDVTLLFSCDSEDRAARLELDASSPQDGQSVPVTLME